MKKNYMHGEAMSRKRYQPLLLLLFCVLWSVAVSAQTQPKVTLKANNMAVPEFLRQLNRQTKLRFLYNQEEMMQLPPVTLQVRNEPLDKVLEAAFKGQRVYYNITNGTLVLRYRPTLEQTPVQATQTPPLTGTITDEEGQPLSHATIQEAGTNRGTYTNEKGFFTFPVTDGSILRISYVGMEPLTMPVGKKRDMKVSLKRNAASKEVVVTGMVTRNRESFTGAVATFTGAELKAIGNQNVVQSLKTLDPSFVIVENNSLGANPNAMPNVEVRGKTSLSTSQVKDQFGQDPNLPLFILDGFETQLRNIIDLDMNRVESITILKDAASTAMYGARAANGVVVVETRKPKQGELQVYYSGDFRVEIPDLRSYNLMDAREKLAFEKLAGRYTKRESDQAQRQVYLDSIYSAHRALVEQGVNSYWLNEPVQIGFTQGHSVYAGGGDEQLRYGVGLNYKKINGAMKGSGRDAWGSTVDLTYRRGRFNISNKLNVSGYTAHESPYGSFSNFAGASPYFPKRLPDGSLAKYLDKPEGDSLNKTINVVNPLYNATLNSFDVTKNMGVQDNLQMIWSFNSYLRLQGGLQLSKETTTRENFVSPLNSTFDNNSIYEKGTYKNTRTDVFSYQANVMLTYARVLKEHSITGNLRAEAQESATRGYMTAAQGFPESSNGNPAFAFSYQTNSRPGVTIDKYRRVNALASVNYMYDSRYMLDLTYRIDGSTAFGSNRKFSPFWSAGIGWNLHQESFFRGLTWVNRLKLRADIGSTGNQNFSSFSSADLYQYYQNINPFGQGAALLAVGNPDLKWQNTLNTNIGTDVTLFDNRFNLTFNAYNKKTDPLIVILTLPTSTGLSGFPANLGYMMTRGVEALANYAVIYKPKQRIIWRVGYTGSMVRSRYEGFNNQLDGLNKQQQDAKSLARFRDGRSPDDIWAVPSLGIDPATGREVLVRKNGETTFDYNTDDIAVVGNSRPRMEGVVSSNLTYGPFSLGINLRYRWGADLFNTALYNKVENISRGALAYNQDKRALYDRWKSPGDVTAFKGISMTSKTEMSSRFVQRENTMVGESINMGYEMLTQPWLKKAGMQSLRLNAYLNDIFRWSTVRAERGTEYPFTNTIAFSVSASF
ncbi:SusC/RagA family TonB-linked outer membrane protein [Chitinophaga varians]|uniref:SusC/RagA family TonB-linked outer membrane protein n=1 Tax=Chitinophaga varians TaxID=2202339 RepID=UPI0016600106|nr:SusC/RagA family TonB-linked outer membrane protein [Chitinophaga varians]MBC9911649.1 SusC/RagA family TonB-linked outer membrane protein [Chitinophaga varians]